MKRGLVGHMWGVIEGRQREVDRKKKIADIQIVEMLESGASAISGCEEAGCVTAR